MAPQKSFYCCGRLITVDDTSGQEKTNCAVCGKPLVYFTEEKLMECSICHKMKPANAACEDGHFVCDECHCGCGSGILSALKESDEKDPVKLYIEICGLDEVHLHGPEHHSIVPCVLLTAYKNCGGEVDLETALDEAWSRGSQMTGGSCAFLGVCGAAAGAGIFASILCGATPLTGKQWSVPQRLTAKCLDAMTKIGGPRCCKRTGRIAIECAAAFAKEEYGVEMPVSRPQCTYRRLNRECIRERCPYFPEQ